MSSEGNPTPRFRCSLHEIDNGKPLTSHIRPVTFACLAETARDQGPLQRQGMVLVAGNGDPSSRALFEKAARDE